MADRLSCPGLIFWVRIDSIQQPPPQRMLRRAGTASIVNLISFQKRLEARIAAVVVAHAADLQAVVCNAWLALLVMPQSSAQDKILRFKV